MKATHSNYPIVVLLLIGLTAQTASGGTIKIGVAQTVIEATLQKNHEKISSIIDQAKSMGCQVVIFPEGALYWSDIAEHKPTKAQLDAAITQIGRKADSEDVYVVFGVGYRQTDEEPYRNRGVVYDPDGRRVLFYKKDAEVPRSFYVCGVPFNLAICSDCGYLEHSDLPCLVQGSQVIIDISGGHGGDDGSIRTGYAQITANRGDLLQSGTSTKTMWFELKGVHSIVTIGDDANLVEIADLAANRGMCLHFHIACEVHTSADEQILAKERNLLMLMYARYGAVVNAAVQADTSNPSALAGGMSMIVSREGGHNRPAPGGLEYYLPYQTSIVASAGSTEMMIFAVRRTSATNNMDLIRNWRNRNRSSRAQSGWHEWIKAGASLIDEDVWLTASD